MHLAKRQMQFTFDMDIWRWFYWDNTVKAEIDDGGYRTVGWAFFVGVRLHRHVDFFGYHQSRHLLDMPQNAPWINQNGVGIRLNIYRGLNERKGIFD